jgi:hypothetical protein
VDTAYLGGAVPFWSGAGAKAGSVPPTATFVPPLLYRGTVGECSGHGLLVADVTGDGVPEVIAVSTQGGANGAGAIHVWRAPGATGSVAPWATLEVAQTQLLGSYAGPTADAVQLSDIDGDGVADLVVATPYANLPGASQAGGLFVWTGGAGLAGAPAPATSLRLPGATMNDRLGVLGVLVADLTGDGLNDLVTASPDADVAGAVDAGRVDIWAGPAPGPLPTATLSGSTAGDRLSGLN